MLVPPGEVMSRDRVPSLPAGTSDVRDIPAVFWVFVQAPVTSVTELRSNISVMMTSGSRSIPTSRGYLAAMPC